MDPTVSSARDRIFEALKKAKPSRISLRQSGEENEIALRTGRTRWDHAAGVIELAFADDADSRAVLFDAEDKILATLVPAEDETREDEDDDAPGSGRDMRLLAMMLKSQDHAVDRVIAMTKTGMDAQALVLKATVDRLIALEKTYADMAQAFHEMFVANAQLRAELTRNLEDASDPLNGLANMAIAHGMQAVTGGAAKLPPNGAKK